MHTGLPLTQRKRRCPERKVQYIDVTQLPKRAPRGEKIGLARFHKNLVQRSRGVLQGNRPVHQHKSASSVPKRGNSNPRNTNMRSNNRPSEEEQSTTPTLRFHHGVYFMPHFSNQTGSPTQNSSALRNTSSNTVQSETIHID